MVVAVHRPRRGSVHHRLRVAVLPGHLSVVLQVQDHLERRVHRSRELRQGPRRRELPAFVLVHRPHRRGEPRAHQRAGVHGRLPAHAEPQGLQHLPYGVLHAQPHRRHRARLHLVDDLRRHPQRVQHLDPAQHHLRLLGPDHPHVLAAGRLHDDHLHRRPAGRPGGHARSCEDRRREQVADPLPGHHPQRHAVHHHLHVPLADQRLQAVRPEPRAHGRPPLHHQP